MKRILSITLAAFILSATFYRCADPSEVEVANSQPSTFDYSPLAAESKVFGEGLNLALGKHLYQSGTSSRIVSNFESIERSTLEYMDQYYEGYSERYYILKSNLDLYGHSGNSNSRTAEEGFDIDSVITDPLQRQYLDKIGGGLVPAIFEYDQAGGDTTDIEAFKAFYRDRMNSIIAEISNDENLADSVKESLIASSYVDMNTIDARVILTLDEMGVLTEEDIAGEINASGRTSNFLKNTWRKLTYPFRGADPGCVALVFGSHIATGAAIGWAAGDNNAGAVKVVTKTLGAVIGGAAGGLVAGWKFLSGKGKDACK